MDRDFHRPVRRHRIYSNSGSSRATDSVPLGQPKTQTAPPQQTSNTKKTVRKKQLRIIAVSLAVIGAGIGGFIYSNRSASPLDSYVKSYDFPLYYPLRMPRDYALVQSSLKPGNDLFIYNVKDTSENTTVTITQQALPSDFDAAKITGKDTPTRIVPSGTLYDLSVNSVSKYMLTTDQGTLIFINSTVKLSKGSANALTSSLQSLK